MKLNIAHIALPLLATFAGSTMALDIPRVQEIVSIQSTPNLMEGIVKTSNPSSAKKITYLPVDVFSHVKFEHKAGDPRGFKPDFANGVSGKPFVILTDNVNENGEYTARVCFPQEIPMNAEIVVKQEYGKYLVRPIDGMITHPTSRRCMDVPYYGVMGVMVPDPVDFAGEFMLIIDKAYQNWPSFS
jgi:hypothetical protein